MKERRLGQYSSWMAVPLHIRPPEERRRVFVILVVPKILAGYMITKREGILKMTGKNRL